MLLSSSIFVKFCYFLIGCCPEILSWRPWSLSGLPGRAFGTGRCWTGGGRSFLNSGLWFSDLSASSSSFLSGERLRKQNRERRSSASYSSRDAGSSVRLEEAVRCSSEFRQTLRNSFRKGSSSTERRNRNEENLSALSPTALSSWRKRLKIRTMAWELARLGVILRWLQNQTRVFCWRSVRESSSPAMWLFLFTSWAKSSESVFCWSLKNV